MANDLPLDSQIETILFFKGEPVAFKKLCEFLEVDDDELRQGLEILENKLKDRGLSLVLGEKDVLLGTSPENSKLIEKITKEELTRDLGKAGLETLSIVLYKNKVSRKEIDYIRGVNSSFILRNLMIRGLIEREDNENGERGFVYRPTTELFAFMGISRKEDLPEYESMQKQIDEFDKKLGEESTIENSNA